MAGNRIYLLDTNVLIHDPEALFSFKGATIGIPIMVLEELDTFKGETTDRGHNARQTIRHLDALRARGSLREGVKLDNGSIVKVVFLPEKKHELPISLSLNLADNLILLSALDLKNRGQDVQFISKDLNARVKADALGIASQDYLKGHVTPERFYQGWIHVQVPANSLKSEFPPELQDLVEEREMTLNEFVWVSSRNNPYNYKVFRYAGNKKFIAVVAPAIKWPLEAKNPQQLMALNLLFDDSIQLINLIGPAGTGKTFLALLAGMYQVLVSETFEKMLISRPVIPLGPDIGYLPGTIEEKLHSWMQPVYDNMEFIAHAINVGRRDASAYETQRHEERYEGHRGSRKKKGKEHHHQDRKMDPVADLIKKGKISLEAITYMRGRSIPYQFILIDEVQNLTPHEVKTLISRVGEGSKIILAGDPYQIDSPYLDFSSNGLIVASNKFKGQRLFGTVFLESSERSELSRMVSEVW
ncbi:MAG: PhoH family protein [Candidatus Babeliales bacterium]